MLYPGSRWRGCLATFTPLPMVRMPSLPMNWSAESSAAPSSKFTRKARFRGGMRPVAG
jgi:hypothetical protein